MQVKALHPGFVGEISGIDLGGALDEDTVAALKDAIDRFAVLVFHGQKLNDERQIAFAARFGKLETVISSHRMQRLARPEMVDVSNLDENNQLRKDADRLRVLNLGNRLWHTDSSFKKVRGALSMLCAHVVPPVGGETQFADLRAAYDALPEATQRHIEGLVAEHSLIHSRTQMGFSDFMPEERAEFAPVRHPVVGGRAGRKTLYLASHASHILGQPVIEGRLLLHDLMEFATQREFVHTHRWRAGDLVIWDNRCTMHRGLAYDESHVRDLRRVTTADIFAENA